MNWLTIYEAGEILAQLAGRPTTQSSPKHVLLAGAECRLPIYWRNSTQRFSNLFGLAGEIPGSSRAVREMQISARDIAQLESRDEVALFIFEPTTDDWLQLQKAQSVDADGDPCGFRALVDGDSAPVSREQLLVRLQDVRHLASKMAVIDDSQRLKQLPTGDKKGGGHSALARWSIKRQKRFRGYTASVHRVLLSAHKAGLEPPTAREILEHWRGARPGEIFEVMPDGIKYYDHAGDPTGEANLKAIGETIRRMVIRGGSTKGPR